MTGPNESGPWTPWDYDWAPDWASHLWPTWVPLEVRRKVESAWPDWKGGPAGWVRDCRVQQAPRFGSYVQLRSGGETLVPGRFVHVANNQGEAVSNRKSRPGTFKFTWEEWCSNKRPPSRAELLELAQRRGA